MESVLTSPTSIAHIVLVYALVISVGLALGRIKVFGVSLGVTFVLFVGLAAGHFGMAIEPHVLTFLRDFGLILFIFFIGLQVGPSFFSSFKSGGIILNGLAAGAIVLSILVTILLWALTAGLIDLPTMLGVHFGAVTNTPGLGATQEALAVMGWEGADIAVAYACAYPLGVVGIIVSAIIIRIIFRVNLAEEDKAWEADEADKNEAPSSFYFSTARRFSRFVSSSTVRLSAPAFSLPAVQSAVPAPIRKTLRATSSALSRRANTRPASSLSSAKRRSVLTCRFSTRRSTPKPCSSPTPR